MKKIYSMYEKMMSEKTKSHSKSIIITNLFDI